MTGHSAALLLAPVRAARVSVLAMAADAEGADAASAGDEAAAAEVVDETGATEVKAEVVEEEEEEDLLNSPAFLKQKLKVLEVELAKVVEETVELQAEAAGVREEWVTKRARLQSDLDNFQTRHRAQILDM